MRFVQQVNALIWSWAEMLRAFRRGVGVWPFVFYAAAQACVVLSVAGFAYPPLSSVVAPLMKWRFGPEALHYPNNYLLLRSTLGQVDMFLTVLLGALATAAAVRLFSSFYQGSRESLGAAWRAASRRYFALVAVAAAVMALSQVVSRLPFTVWAELAESSPSRFRIIRGASLAVAVGLQALFLYAPQLIVLKGRGLGRAVAGSAGLAFGAPVTAYFIVGVPAALELLPLWLSRKSALLAVRLTPEFIVAVMFLWIVVILMAGFATAGAATRFFLYADQEEDDEQERIGRGSAR